MQHDTTDLTAGLFCPSHRAGIWFPFQMGRSCRNSYPMASCSSSSAGRGRKRALTLLDPGLTLDHKCSLGSRPEGLSCRFKLLRAKWARKLQNIKLHSWEIKTHLNGGFYSCYSTAVQYEVSTFRYRPLQIWTPALSSCQQEEFFHWLGWCRLQICTSCFSLKMKVLALGGNKFMSSEPCLKTDPGGGLYKN